MKSLNIILRMPLLVLFVLSCAQHVVADPFPPTNPELIPDVARFSIESRIETTSGLPELHFSIELSENFSEAQYLQLLYWLEGGDQTWITIQRNAETGVFSDTLALSAYAASGTYAARSLRVSDDFGSEIRLSESQLIELGHVTKTTLVNPVSDEVNPQVVSLTLGNATKHPDAGEIRVPYVLAAVDSESGLQAEGFIEILSPSGHSFFSRVYFDDAGSASGELVLPRLAASGTYTVNTIRLYDHAGNAEGSQAWLADNPEVNSFDIVNPEGESNPPTLKKFKLRAQFEMSADRPRIYITGRVNDDVSGVDGIYLRLNRPPSGLIDKWVASSVNMNAYQMDATIPLTTEFVPGEYTVQYLRLNDVAGNQVHLSPEEIKATGSDTSVRVFYPAEWHAPGNKVTASSQNDYVFGANGSDDELLAGAGSDQIYTTLGVDTIDAGDGDDTVFLQQEGMSGQLSTSRIWGGGGADTYVVGASLTPSTVIIEDFDASQASDLIDLSAPLMVSQGLMQGTSGALDSQRQSDWSGINNASSNGVFSWVDTGDSAALYWDPDGESGDQYQPIQTVVLAGVSVEQLGKASLDTDGDGIRDHKDAFLADISASSDMDGDGYPEQWNEGYDATHSNFSLVLDAYPDDATDWQDTDGDGVGDNRDAFPNDRDESIDSDGDGVGDNSDAYPTDPDKTGQEVGSEPGLSLPLIKAIRDRRTQ
ncbi:MAG: hypothetical protein ABJ084_03920 [Halioglobus sp.]